ncbi:hypothetical protein [Limnovirga soli]|uniref:Glycoside hydrolase family 42 N-terminal domain-containing protein n=1 Tax=Limnovirga soli TaxID=2656915 RepID=A0A8J8JXX5_9BACT|nr:hypothetical protein [Limnovirga soli]NNV56766.1 hypothetical protein [Limnovirga soli]
MKQIIVGLFLLLCIPCLSIAQSEQRIPIVSVADQSFAAWNYSNYLNDNLSAFVPSVWLQKYSYSTVIINLQAKSNITRLSLYDYTGVFTNQPAFFYAINGADTVYLGKFTGETYQAFVDIASPFPVVATKIAMKKYGNNIPQKVQVYGSQYIAGAVADSTPIRLLTDSIQSFVNTGMNYKPWLTDNLTDLVKSVYTPINLQYTDVKLLLNDKRAQIAKIRLYDEAGIFTTNPAYVYVLKDTSMKLIGTFQGLLYKQFVDMVIPEGTQADAIIVRKYGNNIPQKVQTFGRTLPFDEMKLIHMPVEDSKVPITSVKPGIITGMDYTPWLLESTDSLVKPVFNAINMQWVDVEVKFPAAYKISKISLFDDAGIFTTNPAAIFIKNDSTLTLKANFQGLKYKEFVDYNFVDTPSAEAIVVRKYGNNIPQKVWAYGKLDTTKKTDTIPIVKIPIEAKRWYTLNYVPNGLVSLFNGVTTESINTGASSFKPTYEALYPIDEGESITLKQIKMFDYTGVFTANPVQLFVIKKDGTRINIGSFTGSNYNVWVGPYPDRTIVGDAQFMLDSAITNIQYIGISCNRNDLPTEIEFYGYYKAPTILLQKPRTYAPFRTTLGMNAFEWDFVRPSVNSRVIAEDKYAAIQNFRGFRHYIDWQKLENTEGQYTFNPTHSGGWDYDLTYERCKRDSIEVLACIQNTASWMQNTWPDSLKAVDNIPLKYGLPKDNPQSYIEYGKVAFQFAARYGSNTNIAPALIKVNTTPRWTNDPPNTVKIGLDYVHYMECGNELDKWWKGINGYMSPYEYAAALSAFYDGHKNALGPDVGVKNADSTIQVVMNGIAWSKPSYVRGMIEWCKQNRGYKADGTINLCWDVINYHHYSTDNGQSQSGVATRGAAPEIGGADSVAQAFVSFSEKYAYSKPVWITEMGFDINQGSPRKAIAIGNKTALQTQADWILRSALVNQREGINHTFFYELNDNNINSSTQYNSMGLTDSVYQRKPAMDYLFQTNALMGNYRYKRTLQTYPIVDEYDLNGSYIYAVWMPTETGASQSCQITFKQTDSVTIYTPTAGANSMHQQNLPVTNGQIQIIATETPVFIKAKSPVAALQYVYNGKWMISKF